MSEKTEKGVTPEAEGLVPEEPETIEEVKEEKYDEAGYKALVAKLREESKQAKKDAKRLAEMEKAEQARADAEKSELQKLQDRAAKLEAEKKALEIRVMRRDVAAKYPQLPQALIDRLKGETPDELEEDAKALVEALPKAQPAKGNPTNPSEPRTGETEAERRKRLLG